MDISFIPLIDKDYELIRRFKRTTVSLHDSYVNLPEKMICLQRQRILWIKIKHSLFSDEMSNKRTLYGNWWYNKKQDIISKKAKGKQFMQ